MVRAAKSIISGFNLTESKKANFTDKVIGRRLKLINSLNEQKLSAVAAIDGKEYYGEKTVLKTDDEGEKSEVIAQKRVKKWFYTNDGETWYLEVRYGNKPLQIAEGKTAIVVGVKDKLADVIGLVIEAVKAKEFDDIITASVKARLEARKARKVA